MCTTIVTLLNHVIRLAETPRLEENCKLQIFFVQSCSVLSKTKISFFISAFCFNDLRSDPRETDMLT